MTTTAGTASCHPFRSLVRRLRSILVLNEEGPPSPVTYSWPLCLYVALAVAGAVAALAARWRPLNDVPTLLIGATATIGMAASAVRSISGVSASWSASVFVHLGMSLALGPPGALAAALADGVGGGVLLHRGLLRVLFNTATHALTNIAAWETAQLAFRSADGDVGYLLAGTAAGAAAWVVNYALLAIVVRIASVGAVPLLASIRSAVTVVPYNLLYGAGAEAFALVHERVGAIGFAMTLAPVVAGQAFLVLLARRTRRHEAELRTAERLERERIARDLHDTVVQTVAGQAMLFAAESGGTSSETELRQMMAEAGDELRDAARDLRTLIIQIAPSSLARDGIEATLRRLLEPLTTNGVSVAVSVADPLPLDSDQAGMIYRVTQEALRNVSAHAHTTNVSVDLAATSAAIVLRVVDDGRGFTMSEQETRRREGHVGTRGIHEAAMRLGGAVAITSAPNHGTQVTLTLPRIDGRVSDLRTD